MKYPVKNKLLDRELLSEQLKRLNAPGHHKYFIVSSYLDTRHGKSYCQKLVSDQLDHCHQYQGASLAFVEHMKQLLQSVIENHWHPDSKTMVIFASHGVYPLIEVMHLSRSIPNRISVYPRADIFPLLKLQQESSNLSLLAYLDGVLQVYDIDLGTIKTKAWASAPKLGYGENNQVDPSAKGRPDKRLQLICQSLLRSQTKPLAIAAKDEDIKMVKNWLPRMVSWKLLPDIELPHNSSFSTFNDYIGKYLKIQHQIEVENNALSLVNALRLKGAAVSGAAETLHALRNDKVTRLLLADKPVRDKSPPYLSHWNPVIEASWLAYRNKIPVLCIEPELLFHIGGMGCMLSKPRDVSVLSVAERSTATGLDLVA
jgi:hypothetical protein